MGKRRRNAAAKKRSPEDGEKSNGKAQENGDKPEAKALDIDDECVNYESSGDEAIQPKAKQVKVVAEESSEDSEGEESEEELEMAQIAEEESEAEVSIEFFDPRDNDVSATALFLDKYVYGCAGRTKESAGKGTKLIPARELAEAVCKQKRVGTMIRVSEEDAPIGFISCLNVNVHKELLKPLREQLLKVCKKEKEEKFAQIVEKTFETMKGYESNRMGLVLCERVVNLPVQVLPKMLEALFCEIEWAVEDEPTEKERENFRLGWFLYVTEVYLTGEELGFVRVEDEAWLEFASHKVMWDLTGEATEGGVKKRRMAMLISKGKVPKVRERVAVLVGQVEAGGEAEGEEEEQEN